MLFSIRSHQYYEALAVVLAVVLCGCTLSEFGRYPKAYPGPRLPLTEVAELSRKDYSLSVLDYSIRSIDGNQIENAAVVEVAPGQHRVGTEVEWSNGFRDSTSLDFSAAPGKKYVVGIYELESGEDPAKAEFSEPSVVKTVAMAPVKLFAIGLTPVILFFTWPALVYIAAQERKQEPPKDRPFDGCCFVWIQDADTGEVIAGVSPKTARGGSSAVATRRAVSDQREGNHINFAIEAPSLPMKPLHFEY